MSTDLPWAAPAPVASPSPAPPRPPRRRAVVGALVTLAGAALVATGSFLTWFSLGDVDFDGFSEIDPTRGDESLGAAFVTLAVVVAGLAATTLVARRIVPIAIAALVIAAFLGVAGANKYLELRDDVDDLDGFGELGPGLPVIVAGSVIALLGSIVVLAMRRRRH